MACLLLPSCAVQGPFLAGTSKLNGPSRKLAKLPSKYPKIQDASGFIFRLEPLRCKAVTCKKEARALLVLALLAHETFETQELHLRFRSAGLGRVCEGLWKDP